MKNFEKYSSKQLEQYGSPVDTDKLWANIDTQLRPRRKKRWLLLLLLPATGMAGMVFLFSDPALSPAPIAADPAHAITSSTVTNSVQKTPGTDPQQDEQVLSGNTPSAVASSAPLSQKNEPAKSGVFSPIQSKSIYYNEKIKSVETGSVLSIPFTHSNLNTSPTTQMVTEAVQEARSATMPEVPAAMIEVPAASQQTNPELILKPTENNTPSVRNSIAVTRLPHTEPHLFHRNKIKLPKHISDCYDWKTKSFKPFVSVYGGLAYPVRHLELKDVNYTTEFDKRNLTEKVLESWHAGITLGMEHRSGFSAEVGLHYQQINERFYMSQFLRDTMGSQLVITTIIHAPGDTSKFEELLPILRETTTTMERYNKYRFLSVPVSVRYDWNQSRKWQPYLRAGAFMNLMATQKATFFYGDAPETFNSLTKPRPTDYPFKTRIGIDLFGAIGIKATVTRQYSLFGEIRYQHPLYEITNNTYPIGQRYRLPGVTIGGIFSF